MGEQDHKVFGRFDACTERPMFLDKAITYGLDKELLQIMRSAMDANINAGDTDDSSNY